ncbi:rod shape-determining protein MreC [Deltaproteobacteria bacterium OttesenSCG-928-M10]|nr:rod shape-determining protein MreC [Deltaproteobacteria bacterium OttesenSCG-928-M10]
MFSRLKWFLPALTLFLAMLLLSASSRQQGAHVPPFLLEVVGPIQNVLTSSARQVERLWRNYFNLVGVRQENEALRKALEHQQNGLVQLAEYKAANERLTSLLGLRQAYPHLTMKPAHVIAWDPGPWNRSVIISIGARDGVVMEQAVIHNQGVVGKVVEVAPNYARVLLATDFNSSIDSFVQRTRAVGILSGQGSRPMIMKYVRKDEDVRPGDLVVTSGLDGFFPRGLALGTVGRISRQSADIFMAVEVTPVVVFDRLEEVMVIVNQAAQVDWLSLAPSLRPLVEDAEAAEEFRRRTLAGGEGQ